MAWVSVAIGAGTAVAKAIGANQTKQRNKGYINDAYRRQSQQLDITQAGAREDSAESLNARGLAQGGSVTASPIHAAMIDGLMRATGAPNTIGGQVQSNAGVQMALERTDLDTQHSRALKANKVGYTNALIDAGVSGIGAGENVHSAMSDYAAARPSTGPGSGDAATGAAADAISSGLSPLPGPSYTPAAAPAVDRSAVHSALLSATSFDGVHPNNPLGDETSSWYTGAKAPKLADPSQSNASFTVG